MAFKLTKEEKDSLADTRRTAGERWDEFKNLAEDLELARQKYLDAREAVTNVVTEVSSRLRAEFDEKSENWQQSDKGSETEDFVCQWEAIENEVEDPDEVPAFDGFVEFGEALDALPEEV
jgi:hypothetical protein